MWALLVAVAIAGCACARTAAAAGGVVDSLQAFALLSSNTGDAYDHPSIALHLRVTLYLGDNNADDAGGASFSCKSVKKKSRQDLPCPGSKGRMDISPASQAPFAFPSPIGDTFLRRYVLSMHFDGGVECVADAYPTFALSALYQSPRPPLAMLGTYACTRDGVETDRGALNLWQQGAARIRPIVP
jgi:hypothetical protein